MTGLSLSRKKQYGFPVFMLYTFQTDIPQHRYVVILAGGVRIQFKTNSIDCCYKFFFSDLLSQ